MPGKRLNSQSQQLVLNVLDFFEREKQSRAPLININAAIERAAAALKISTQTIRNIKQRKGQNPLLSSPGKKRPRVKPKTEDLRESSKMEVRNTIYNMYKEKKHVTLLTLKRELLTKAIIDISKSSLSLLLKDIGFKFKKEDNRRALVEKYDIALYRSTFLRKYTDNLKSNSPRPVIFLDETWIYSKGNRGRSWQDASTKSVRKPEGYDGKRFIVLHAGGKSGFIEDASLIFASKTKAKDYHAEMNSKMFEEWIKIQFMPHLPNNSLVTMDNAPYHSVVLNKIPNSASRKQEIIDWLSSNNISFSGEFTKYELLDLVRRNKPEKLYLIDEILKGNGHEVLRLPPYHCEFYAIELIWAAAKGYYDQNIGRDGYGDDKALNMWNEALEHCTVNTWQNCIRHTNNLISKWYHRERHLVDMDIQPIIINPNETSSSGSDLESE